MNFNTVRQAMGQKDERGYDVKVTMCATFRDIAGITFTKNQKQTCIVKLQDGTGEAHNVHLYGTMPEQPMNNQRAEFALSAFNGNAQGGPYVGYSGFWNSRANVNQSQQQTQQPIPNQYGGKPDTPSPARDVVSEPHHVPVEPAPRDFGAEEASKQTSIERQVCVKAVGDMVVSRPQMDKYGAADWLAFYQGWIETGNFPFDVTHQPVDTTDFTDPNQDDSDLPPELRG